jgi:hypothetical protein
MKLENRTPVGEFEENNDGIIRYMKTAFFFNKKRFKKDCLIDKRTISRSITETISDKNDLKKRLYKYSEDSNSHQTLCILSQL